MTATESARAANVLVQAALDWEAKLREYRATPNQYYSGPDPKPLEEAVQRFRDEAVAAAMEHWWGMNEQRINKLDEMVTKPKES